MSQIRIPSPPPEEPNSVLAYSSSTPATSRPINAELAKWAPGPYTLCSIRTPEPHLLGEFPMTCYRCHLEADS